MRVDEFLERLKLAASVKSLYVRGCFGAPMNDKNKSRYTNNHKYNMRSDRKQKILSASTDTFGSDCSGIIKACLGSWSADLNHVYGGTIVNKEQSGISYGKDHVPDLDDAGMIRACKDATTNFSDIEPGCLVWKSGHVGVYVGDGKVIESTPSFKDGCQYTNLGNLGFKTGNYRNWTKWGHLPWVEYKTSPASKNGQNGGNTQAQELYYIVVKDDNLSKIGNKFGVPWKSIAKLNGIPAPYTIYPGQKIRIK